MEAESVRLLEESERSLRRRDIAICRSLALRAKGSHPNLAGADRLLAVADVLLAASAAGGGVHYAVLELEPRCDDLELIRSRFQRLALLLNPATNKAPFAAEAFNRVVKAWAVLSSEAKKAQYDAASVPPASTGVGNGGGGGTFWTVCPYCYYVFEYDRVYEECCLRCQNCRKPFHGVAIAAQPPAIPGKDAYDCCLGYFPLGFGKPGRSEEVNGDKFRVNGVRKEAGVVEISDDSEEEEKVESRLLVVSRASGNAPGHGRMAGKSVEKMMGNRVKNRRGKAAALGTRRLDLNVEMGDEVPDVEDVGDLEKKDWKCMNLEFSEGCDNILVTVPDCFLKQD